MRCKKRAFTDYIIKSAFLAFGGYGDYLKYPRRLKKAIKSRIQRVCYYDKRKKRVWYFNPNLLNLPVPNFIDHMIKPDMPLNSGSVFRFRRPESLVELE